jgi:hypothetical protein
MCGKTGHFFTITDQGRSRSRVAPGKVDNVAFIGNAAEISVIFANFKKLMRCFFANLVLSPPIAEAYVQKKPPLGRQDYLYSMN